MAEWREVNRLQAEISRAEKDFDVLCQGWKRARAAAKAKKQELTDLYDQQDRTVREVLGPRSMQDIEKKTLEDSK